MSVDSFCGPNQMCGRESRPVRSVHSHLFHSTTIDLNIARNYRAKDSKQVTLSTLAIVIAARVTAIHCGAGGVYQDGSTPVAPWIAGINPAMTMK